MTENPEALSYLYLPRNNEDGKIKESTALLYI